MGASTKRDGGRRGRKQCCSTRRDRRTAEARIAPKLAPALPFLASYAHLAESFFTRFIPRQRLCRTSALHSGPYCTLLVTLCSRDNLENIAHHPGRHSRRIELSR